MAAFSEATKGYKKPRRGRPTGGGKKKAAWALAYALFKICEKAGLKPKRNNQGGSNSIIHKILEILRTPLNIGQGEFDGVFDELLKEIREQNELTT